VTRPEHVIVLYLINAWNLSKTRINPVHEKAGKEHDDDIVFESSESSLGIGDELSGLDPKDSKAIGIASSNVNLVGLNMSRAKLNQSKASFGKSMTIGGLNLPGSMNSSECQENGDDMINGNGAPYGEVVNPSRPAGNQ